ncbi:MAG: hypothetical protein K6G28_05115, partial [Acholeplasmatales bacterium]|nr:hypothetical protein [Acholeplasmatales bacterium]
MNSLALVLKNKSLDFDSLNEFLSSIEEDVIINETIDYYKVVFKDADIKLLKEAFESYLFDADSKMKVYLDTFESEEELEDKLDVISKYFNDSLTGFIYDSKTLLDE